MSLHVKARTRAAQRDQRGLSAVMILAVLVMLGTLSAYAVGLVTSVHNGHATELSHARATQAAEAGLDWGRFRISAGAGPSCVASQTLTLASTLAPYRVTVRCTLSVATTEGGPPLSVYRVSASACNVPAGGNCPNATASADYVERVLSSIVER